MISPERWDAAKAELRGTAASRKRAALLLRAVAFIATDRLKDESELTNSKWFDYRFLSAAEGTAQFADEYVKLYARKWKQSFDREASEKKRALPSGGLFHDSREFSSFWHVRQIADAFGIPYPFFIDHAMQRWLDRAKQDRLPRPNQLYSEDMLKHVLDRWEEWTGSVLTISKLPQYRVEHFRGLPVQLAHQEWVVEQIRRRANPVFHLSTACFVRCVLPEARAVLEFGQDLVDRARSEAKLEKPEPLSPVSNAELTPSCFGVPHAFQAGSEACSECPFNPRCEAAGTVMLALMERRYGSADPVRARKQANDRERARRSRAKKRLATPATAGS